MRERWSEREGKREGMGRDTDVEGGEEMFGQGKQSQETEKHRVGRGLGRERRGQRESGQEMKKGHFCSPCPRSGSAPHLHASPLPTPSPFFLFTSPQLLGPGLAA